MPIDKRWHFGIFSRILRTAISCIRTPRLPSVISDPLRKMVFERFFWEVILRRLLIFTARIRVNDNSKTEIHSVLGRSQVTMCIYALKSFLRFYADIAVVVHCDGGVDEKSISLLRRHIIGVRIIRRNEADNKISEMISSRSCIAARKFRVNYLQAFDYFFLSKAKKIVGLDSDVLFFKYPAEVIDWILSEDKQNIYEYEETAGRFDRDKELMECNEETIKTMLPGVNAGLFCVYRQIADFGLAERHLDFLMRMDKFHEFPYAQNIISLYLSHSTIPSQPLSISKYKTMTDYFFNIYNAVYDPAGFRRKSIFKHYNYRTIRNCMKYGYARDALRVFSELFFRRSAVSA